VIDARGLSAYAVGQLADTDPGVVSRFLTGQRSLRLDTVDRIALVLGLRLVETATRRVRARANTPPPTPAEDTDDAP
jgi:hypothetical protein